MVKYSGCILVSVALFWPLALWIHRASDTPGPDFYQAVARCTYPGSCLPERGEQTTYIFGALCLPALIFATSAVARRLETQARLPRSVSCIAELALACLLLVFCAYAFR